LEAYRDEVQAKNLNISYRSLMKYDEVEEPPAKKIRKSQSLQQDFQAAKVFLRNLRFEQERRDKHLEIELSKNERARKRAEFEIRQDAVLRYAKACQEENRLNELARHSQLIEEEKKFRSTLKLPIFVKFFFEIEENYFPGKCIKTLYCTNAV
jgi:hypothetical protein